MPDPFERYADLILAAADADDAAHRAAVGVCHTTTPTPQARADLGAAELAVLDAQGDVAGFEMDRASEWLMGLRLALKWYPAAALGLLEQAATLAREQEEAHHRLWWGRAG